MTLIMRSLRRRWFAEPVRAIIVPADIFLTNKQGASAGDDDDIVSGAR